MSRRAVGQIQDSPQGSECYAALYHRRSTTVLYTVQGAPHCKQWLQALHAKQVECDSFIVQSWLSSTWWSWRRNAKPEPMASNLAVCCPMWVHFARQKKSRFEDDQHRYHCLDLPQMQDSHSFIHSFIYWAPVTGSRYWVAAS